MGTAIADAIADGKSCEHDLLGTIVTLKVSEAKKWVKSLSKW